MIVSNSFFDEERAFYGSSDVKIEDCGFDGPADGESAFKESRNVVANRCFFNLRYPFWHCRNITIILSEMTPLCRAAIWYSKNISLEETELNGIKALRECEHAVLVGCRISSPEFGWFCKNVKMGCTKAEGDYFMFRSRELDFTDVSLKGKYSFQYITDSHFQGCRFETKDALWHAKNVVLKDCTIKGEYLGWYCENVTLENCVIEGTQPLCYCKGLKLINCEMHGADLAFEKSDVQALITTPIISVKNPASGFIKAPQVNDIIMDQPSECVLYIGEDV